MKTPISYYGGKQTMLKHILPLIPDHKLYTEAFCGGAAVLFAKKPCYPMNGAGDSHYSPPSTFRLFP